jgi:hypothetical protein
MTAGDKRQHAARAALADLTRPERTCLGFASMLTVAAGLAWVGQAYLLAGAIGALQQVDSAQLLEFAALFAVFVAIKVACEATASWLMAATCQRIQLQARERLLRAVAGFSPLDWKRPHSGEISTVMTDGVAMKPGIKILLTSGYAEQLVRGDDDLQSEQFRVLRKPYQQADLVAALREVLGHRS